MSKNQTPQKEIVGKYIAKIEIPENDMSEAEMLNNEIPKNEAPKDVKSPTVKISPSLELAQKSK